MTRRAFSSGSKLRKEAGKLTLPFVSMVFSCVPRNIYIHLSLFVPTFSHFFPPITYTTLILPHVKCIFTNFKTLAKSQYLVVCISMTPSCCGILPLMTVPMGTLLLTFLLNLMLRSRFLANLAEVLDSEMASDKRYE